MGNKLMKNQSDFGDQKKKGKLQHSSFLAGSVTIAAGRLIVNNGILEVKLGCEPNPRLWIIDMGTTHKVSTLVYTCWLL
jgi:hypothetical protein